MNVTDKMPPHNLEAEMSAIGSALHAPAAYDELSAIARPEDFYRADHAAVWRAMGELAREAKPIDALSVADRMARFGDQAWDRWERLLSDCASAAPHAANGTYYAAIVAELARLRRLAEAAGKAIEICYGPRDRPACELVAEAERVVLAAARDDGRESDTAPAEVVLAGSLEQLSVRGHGVPAGLATGFRVFDAMLDGLRPGQLVILAARPGQGKTSLAIDIANHVAFVLRRSVVFCSLEMGRHELGDRVLSSLGKVPGTVIRSGRGLSNDDWERMGKVQEASTRVRFAIDDASSRSVSELAAICRRRKASRGLDLVVVDYLQLVRPEAGKGANRQEQVAKVSRDLKCMAKDLGVPVLALSQLSRDVEKREDQRPRLSDLRESGAIEQDADVVLLLYHTEGFGPSTLSVAKNRSGPTGNVDLNYRKEFTSFEDWSPVASPAGAAF